MTTARWISLGLLLVGGAALAAWRVQRRETEALRAEIGLRRGTSQALAEARAENERWRAAQPPATELERLRADRAALVRMRAEIATLEESAARKASGK